MPFVTDNKPDGSTASRFIELTRLQYQILEAMLRGAILQGMKPEQPNGEPNPAQPYHYTLHDGFSEVQDVSTDTLTKLFDLRAIVGHVAGKGLSPPLKYDTTPHATELVDEARPYYDKNKVAKGAE
jgi:hypothetical protein